MYSLHCTKKLIDRIQEPIAAPVPTPTTRLGSWYATALFWRPQLMLAVNERTLLPVLMPLAPAAAIAHRFPAQLATVLAAHGIDQGFIEREVAAMAEVSFAKTASRSVVGIMNEFSFLAEGYRECLESFDLITLTMRLAETPCKPIKYDSPAGLIKEIVRHQVV
ncbi:DUF6933 domain-containing protein [Nitrosospira briensis]|uniref:DUF6933 domain-containing protein n=1 Tax=Nitrosospira briensis TaxID=35799 RepID=UPI0009449015